MSDDIIGVLDSGLGGISLLFKLYENLSNKKFIYLGDSKNIPYGNKSKNELLDITFNNVLNLKSYGAKKIFIGCNTLSCVVLEDIKSIFNEIEFYKVFPPIESCIMQGLNPLLLCTFATAEKYRDSNIDVIAFESLAKDIEEASILKDFTSQLDLSIHLKRAKIIKGAKQINSFCDKSSKLTTDKLDKWLKDNNLLKRCVILGCTHYFFVKKQIFNHFQPLKIIDPTTFTLDYFMKKHKINKSLVKQKGNELIFLGKNNNYYKKIFYSFENK